MVLTRHFIDNNWRLNKRVLSFVCIPPAHCGVEIADSIYKCLKEWGIENKVYTISIDNTSSSDVAMRILRDNFSRNRKLLCVGKLFHVRCCAHILNLLVQDSLSQIKYIIEDIHESVSYVNQTEDRLIIFLEIVQQLQLPHRKLILDCRTSWNSTYKMLATALKFKEVFPRFRDKEPQYNSCPKPEDWEKLEKVGEILKVFSSATNIISRFDYPTSNIFLIELFPVKELLDKKSNDENEFILAMVKKMKDKFDKYWGECNLLMDIATILDPRFRMKAIEFCYSKMCPEHEARENIISIREALYELYEEYVAEDQSFSNEQIAENKVQYLCSGWSGIAQFMMEVESVQPQKSDLDRYLEERCVILEGGLYSFDALEWWKVNNLRYRILSRMAHDILAIPFTMVASEDIFNAGSKVIDTYQASLSPETAQILVCGGDWCRNLNGVKKINKKEKKPVEIMLPIS